MRRLPAPAPLFPKHAPVSFAPSPCSYAWGEPFIVTMETITAFAWGPACFLIAYAMYAALPWRHAAIVLVSTGQLYGCVLYYYTSVVTHFEDTHDGLLFFWCYFVLMNAIWIVVPACAIAHAFGKISTALHAVEAKAVKAIKTAAAANAKAGAGAKRATPRRKSVKGL